MCRKLKKMYFPVEMLKLMLCLHERLLQEAPCQRGMTNKENFATMLRTCIHVLLSLQGGRGTWWSLPLPHVHQSFRAAVWRLLCINGAAQVAPSCPNVLPRSGK